MLKCGLLFYFVVSCFMLMYSPDTYSREYCSIEAILFCCFSFFYLKHKIRRSCFLNFDTLFLFSFGCINYLHSVFIYPDDTFLPAFTFPYNMKIATYALSVASVGIAAYMLGNIYFERKCVVEKKHILDDRMVTLLEKVAIIVSVCLFFYVFGVLRVDYGLKHLYPRLMLLIVALISLSCYSKAIYLKQNYGNESISLKVAIKENKWNILAIVLFAISLLSIGSRGSVIFLILFSMGIVDKYYYKLKIGFVIPMFLFAIIFMSILTLTRTTSINLSNSSIWDVVENGYGQISKSANFLWVVLLDLIVNARTLYDGIEYTISQGYLYGASYIQYFFCFVPGGGMFITSFLLDKTTMEVATGEILTKFSHAPYGIGTNMIGDIYMNFSLIGVIVLLFLFGILVGRCESCETKYQSFLYYSLLANSIYVPRASVFCWIDLFVMLVLCELLFRSISKRYCINIGKIHL